MRPRFWHVFTKLAVMKLAEYQKVLLLDAEPPASTPLLHFPRLLRETGEHLCRTLSGEPPWDLASLLLSLRGRDGESDSPRPGCWDAAGSLLEWLSAPPPPRSRGGRAGIPVASVATVLLLGAVPVAG